MRARAWTKIAWTILACLTPGVLLADHRPPEVIATVPVTGTNLAVDADADRVYVSSATELTVVDGKTNAIAGTLVVRPYVVIGEPGNVIPGGQVPVATGEVDVNPATGRVYLASHRLYVIDGSALEVLTTIPARGQGFWAVGVNSHTNTIYATFPSVDGSWSLAVIDGHTNRVTNVAPYGGTVLAVDEDADRVYVQSGQDVFSLDGQGHLIAQRRFDRYRYGSLVMSSDAHQGGFFMGYHYLGEWCPEVGIDRVDGLTLHGHTEWFGGIFGISEPRGIAANPVTGRFYLHWFNDCDPDGHASSSLREYGTWVTTGLEGAWSLRELQGHRVRDIEINPVSGRGYVLAGGVVVIEGHHPEE